MKTAHPNRRSAICALLSSVVLLASSTLRAAQTEAGLTLLESPGARSAALSEAFSTAPNDIAAFGYNPAALSTLRSGHASFSFHRGTTDDFYGQMMIGASREGRGLGLSVGYYDGGSL